MLKHLSLFAIILFITNQATAQNVCTPEFLWSLGRVSAHHYDAAEKNLYYTITHKDVKAGTSSTEKYRVNIENGHNVKVSDFDNEENSITDGYNGAKISSNGNYMMYSKEVEVEKIAGKDIYPEYSNSEIYVYNDLNERHWDTWEDGKYSHLFLAKISNDQVYNAIDLLAGQKYDCPTMPFGGSEDYIFTPDNRGVIYVCKKKYGKEYAVSTNTDLYYYDIALGTTSNITNNNPGYDLNPCFSADGRYLAWTQMKRDGYESDKNDIVVMNWKDRSTVNLTAHWDGTVGSFFWSPDNEMIYFIAAVRGTEQIFAVPIDEPNHIHQITHGQFNITGIIAQNGNTLLVSRTDMNHAAELFSVQIADGKMEQLSHANDAQYASIELPKVEGRYTPLNNGESLFSWVIYPPNFDPHKKYPTLLYCQGGPQSALSQFYSFRWNFQLMASQGYIVIAPNRTGMPGWGVKWNEDISGDWGGAPMRDYLAAIDDISEESYVDKSRLGAVGASYGGYSVFMLAGIHEGRFKTFISHCGLFDLPSWYLTTEELFFANWDIGGAYWDKKNAMAQQSYRYSNPSNYIDKWDTPILIFQGGKDYRVPFAQGLQAFQAARIKGIKSRFVYLPNENHWVLNGQNAIIWQKEFYRWLKETL